LKIQEVELEKENIKIPSKYDNKKILNEKISKSTNNLLKECVRKENNATFTQSITTQPVTTNAHPKENIFSFMDQCLNLNSGVRDTSPPKESEFERASINIDNMFKNQPDIDVSIGLDTFCINQSNMASALNHSSMDEFNSCNRTPKTKKQKYIIATTDN